jgi:hypothetical protein
LNIQYFYIIVLSNFPSLQFHQTHKTISRIFY